MNHDMSENIFVQDAAKDSSLLRIINGEYDIQMHLSLYALTLVCGNGKRKKQIKGKPKIKQIKKDEVIKVKERTKSEWEEIINEFGENVKSIIKDRLLDGKTIFAIEQEYKTNKSCLHNLKVMFYDFCIRHE